MKKEKTPDDDYLLGISASRRCNPVAHVPMMADEKVDLGKPDDVLQSAPLNV
jgi:hypothetical protein